MISLAILPLYRQTRQHIRNYNTFVLLWCWNSFQDHHWNPQISGWSICFTLVDSGCNGLQVRFLSVFLVAERLEMSPSLFLPTSSRNNLSCLLTKKRRSFLNGTLSSQQIDEMVNYSAGDLHWRSAGRVLTKNDDIITVDPGWRIRKPIQRWRWEGLGAGLISSLGLWSSESDLLLSDPASCNSGRYSGPGGRVRGRGRGGVIGGSHGRCPWSHPP